MSARSKLGFALAIGLAACSGGSKGSGASGIGGVSTGDVPMGGGAEVDIGGAAGATTGETGGAPDTGGSPGTGGDDATGDDDASAGTTMVGDDAAAEAEESETGKQMLFSFDGDSDFRLCGGGVVLPPCWLISVDGMPDVDGGSLAPVADEAVAGHEPARAGAWTAVHQSYGANVRIVTTFPSNRNWSNRTRLHLSLKVTSGLSSIDSFDLFIQGGVEVAYQAIYQLNLVDALTSDAGSSFTDFWIDFTSPDVNTAALNGVSGVGVVLRAVAAPAEGSDAVPPPTVLELDDIWVE